VTGGGHDDQRFVSVASTTRSSGCSCTRRGRIRRSPSRTSTLTSDRCDELAAQLDAEAVIVPQREQLEAVGDLLRATIQDSAATVVKDLLNALIHRVEIRPDRHAQPFFQLASLPQNETPEPDRARASDGTSFCMDSHQVEKAVSYSNSGVTSGQLDELLRGGTGQPVRETGR
jgi:hypothetical protein